MKVGTYSWRGKTVLVEVVQTGSCWAVQEEMDGVKGEGCAMWFGNPAREPSDPPRKIGGFIFQGGALKCAKEITQLWNGTLESA